MKPVSDTAYWNKLAAPLKRAMRRKPRTWEELKELLQKQFPKQTELYLQNVLAFLNMKGVVVYSSETKLWRMSELIFAPKPKVRSGETLQEPEPHPP